MKKRKKGIVRAVCASIVCLGFVFGPVAVAGDGSTHPTKPDSFAATKTDKQVPGTTILFFMNPNGRPCQMQKAIIDAMADSLKHLAQVTYVKTTEAADEQKFENYGIQGLPSLIVVDKNGKEIKRFTPGIQSRQTILTALHSKAK